jgi:hypothetical protein
VTAKEEGDLEPNVTECSMSADIIDVLSIALHRFS